MSQWREIALGESAELLTGFPFKSANYTDDESGIALVRGDNVVQGRFRWDDVKRWPKNETAEISNYFLQTGDVILAMDRPWIDAGLKYACVSAEDLPCLLVQRVTRLRARNGLDQSFLRYVIGSREFTDYVLAVQTGTAVPHISSGQIKQFRFQCPPLPEQRAIASVLGALDDKIELNRRMNETLEALAQSLFKSWFVDATQSALPKGWRYATISELCEINSWTLGKGDELDQIEYVEISEVMRGNIANIQSYERGEEPSRARRRLRHGDTVLSTVRPDRGAYFLCLNPSPNLIGSTGFAVLTPAKAPWSFIHAAMTQADVFEYLGQQADGGAYPAVRPEIIGGLEVPWPNKPELVEEFHRTCAPLYERAELNRHESRTLAALRDALLPKLLSGELHVPAATGSMEARA